MSKGSQFERDLCYELSRWWTRKKNRLVFWRTSNSGGGATVRARKGIKNKSHAGDITSTEKTSRPLTRLITMELKIGYTAKKGKKKQSANIHDLVDRVKQQSLYEDWIIQAVNAAHRADTPYWMLIHHRDRRRTMAFFPSVLYAKFWTLGCFTQTPTPFVSLMVKVGMENLTIPIVGMELRRFLGHVDPEDVKQLLRMEGRK